MYPAGRQESELEPGAVVTRVKLLTMEVVVKENDVMVDVTVTITALLGRFIGGWSLLIDCSIEEASSGWSWLRASRSELRMATADASSLSQKKFRSVEKMFGLK